MKLTIHNPNKPQDPEQAETGKLKGDMETVEEMVMIQLLSAIQEISARDVVRARLGWSETRTKTGPSK